jgi:tetratricopeptide (TPR) repeat protein
MAPVNSLLPAHGKLWYEYRGDAFFEIRQYQAATADFSRAIALAPQEIYSYRLRGRSYYFLNEYDKATLDYSIALRIVPNDGETIGYLKDMQRRMRDSMVLFPLTALTSIGASP